MFVLATNRRLICFSNVQIYCSNTCLCSQACSPWEGATIATVSASGSSPGSSRRRGCGVWRFFPEAHTARAPRSCKHSKNYSSQSKGNLLARDLRTHTHTHTHTHTQTGQIYESTHTHTQTGQRYELRSCKHSKSYSSQSKGNLLDSMCFPFRCLQGDLGCN